MTIRIGFIGTGLISHMHLAFLMTSSEPNQVVAVHDVDPDRARAFASLCGASVLGMDEVLDTVDLVYVTTWTSEHPALVRAAARRGVAVYCEKPLATTVAQVEQMIADVEHAGVPNQVGLVLRSLPAWLLVRDLVSHPDAGRVMAVSFRDDQYIPVQGRYASTWRGDPARAGRGALIEHSIHDVDILQWVFGDVVEVTGRVREFHALDRIDDVATAQLAFGSGAIASLTSVWHDVLERPSMRFVEVFCERLTVSLDGDAAATVRWQYTGHDAQQRAGAELVQECRDRGIAPSDDVTELLGGRVFNPATPFLQALCSGEPSPLPLREALAAHRIVDAVYRSADDGARPVAIGAG